MTKVSHKTAVFAATFQGNTTVSDLQETVSSTVKSTPKNPDSGSRSWSSLKTNSNCYQRAAKPNWKSTYATAEHVIEATQNQSLLARIN
ncbi:hypothetical protein GX48_07926 [Paracoccidioides brasiliensis]|nr:hypothetical protein GX48_07926 [Paracoccidioides brasiliensis]